MNYSQLKMQVCKMLGLENTDDLKDNDNLIEMGLNSLKIIRIASILRKGGIKVSSGMMMENPTLEAWGKMIEKAENSQKDKKTASEPNISDQKSDKKAFPLTDVQYAYLIGRSDDQPLGGIGCHAYLEFDNDTAVDVKRLDAAWKKVREHHPMLRAKFSESGTQEIMPHAYDEDVNVRNLTNMTEEDAKQELLTIRENLSHRKLDVYNGQVAGITVSMLPNNGSRIHFDIDLLVADVQSLQIVLRDLLNAYLGRELPEKSGVWNFADYINKQNTYDEEGFLESKEYWNNRIENISFGPGLPLAKRPEEVNCTRFKRRRINVTNEEWKKITDKAASNKTTPAVVLMAAYSQILERWSTNKKFLINIPLFNRQTELDGIEDVIADFTTLVLLEVDCSGKQKFTELICRIQKQLHSDIRHSRYSGVKVQRDISAYYGEQLNVAPVVFACNLGNPLVDDEFTEKLGKFSFMISQTPQVWIDFQSYENKDGLMLTWDTVDELFPEGMIDDMFTSFGNLIKKLASSDWNAYFDVSPKDYTDFVKREAKVGELKEKECIHSSFVKWCKKTPDAIALIDSERGVVLTYGQLYKKCLAAASAISKKKILGQPIALTLNRGFEQIVAAMAIVMSGNFYVPVSIEQPTERRKLIHEKTGIKHVLTNKDVKNIKWQNDVNVMYLVDLEVSTGESESEMEQLLPDVSPDDSAYIIMTSGTTGLPKGVEIRHSGAWNTIQGINSKYGINPGDTALAISSMDFDLSVYDVFGILGAGGKLVTVSDERKKDADFWVELVEKHGITVWNSVPILLEMLLISAGDKKLPLRIAMLSGDWIGLDLPEKVAKHTDGCKFVAMGGATEASIWSNYLDVQLPIPSDWKSIPYGRALNGQAYRVVDANGNDCPYWCEGELWIGGHGVAKGYRGDAELTSKKFVEDDLGRWYRTGDNGRFWKDGTIEFLGRKDNQVKVRGHRIEIGEIEKALKNVQGVNNVVVDAVGDKNTDKHLVAFVEGSDDKNSDIAMTIKSEPQNLDIWEKCSKAGFVSNDKTAKAYEKIKDQTDIAVYHVINKLMSEADSYDKKWNCLIRRWRSCIEKNKNLGDNSISIEEDYSKTELYKKIQEISKELPNILKGNVGELEVFYNGKKALTPNGFLNEIPGQKEITDNLCVVLKKIESSKTLKILELGTRDANVSKMIRSALSGVQAEYSYVDNSKFFVDMAGEELTGSETEFAVLNYEKDIAGTALSENRYDIVIAYNSLHRCTDVNKVMSNIKYVLAPSGVLFVQEMTEENSIQEITAAVLEHGFGKIKDLRSGKNRGLFDNKMLEKIFDDSDFADKVITKDIYGNTIVFARYKDEKVVFTSEKIAEIISDKLPEYMVPKVYRFFKKLPTSRNGKLDRKAMRKLVDSAGIMAKGGEAKTNTEKILLDIWRGLFSGSNIGVEDNYFALGGDSLVATKLITEVSNRFGKRLSIARIFEKPTVRELAAELDALGEDKSDLKQQVVPADASNINKPFPLTDVQYAYWIGRNGLYDLGGVATHCYFELAATDLSFDRAEFSFNELIRKHDMMRAVISSDGTQRILKESEVGTFKIRITDISELDVERQGISLEKKREDMSHQVIDVTKWPLYDVQITKKNESESIIHISFDNIIFDGFSMFHILSEWSEVYRSKTGKAKDKVSFSFRDYVLELERQKQTDRYAIDEKYWMDRIDDFSLAPQLPLMKKESEVKDQRFSRKNERLSKEEWIGIKKYAEMIKVTPSVLLMGAYAEVLRLWSSNDDLTINLTQFNRKPFNKDVEKLIGDFTTLTLLEIKRKTGSFAGRCREIQKQLAEDMEHSLYSAVEFERQLKKKNSNSKASIMPIVFTSGLGVSEWNDGKWLGNLVYNISQTPQVWLDHQVVEMDGELCLFWDYVKELFDPDMIDAMFGTYVGLLKNIALGKVGSTEKIVIKAPISKIRAKANQTTKTIEPDTLDGMFLKACSKYPNNIAVVTDNITLTYKELYNRAISVRDALKLKGMQKNDIAAIMFNKGWEQIAAVYGVLLAGGVYLPLDVNNPDNRLQKILSDSGTYFVVTSSEISTDKTCLAGKEVVLIDELSSEDQDIVELRSPNSPEERAYVIYTSGTTGTPKGVVISHKGAVNTIKDVVDKYGITSADRAFAISNLHFDLSVFDIFGLLGVGGSIFIPDHRKVKEPSYWAEAVRDKKITIWNSVPAFMEMLIEYVSFSKNAEKFSDGYGELRLVLMSGDWIPVTLPERIRAIYPKVVTISLGGATEASIWSNDYVIAEDFDRGSRSVPYGKPLSNQRFYVLDSELEDCPDLVPGGLYIAGSGLAEGYLNDEVKTNEKFFVHKGLGERLYSTGDMGRYLKDGNIEFLGRIDDQVKINGYRVELGEIEDALRKLKGVKDAIAILGGDSTQPILGAVLVTDETAGDCNDDAFKKELKDYLPSYMIPSVYIRTDSFELTGNGKVNRAVYEKSLLDRRNDIPDPKANENKESKDLTEQQHKLVNIWEAVLGTEVGIDDNFFELGGSSLQAIKIVNMMDEKTDVVIEVGDLFENPTISDIDKLLTKRGGQIA